ncbi:ALG14-like protein [Mya arenaria]|uniref:UDP-N-acetylglucosamine transferase subunit ALG14 n=1 Tax=Mya arenaria TaxID=6604 RepID=A0ABY7FQR8_MYAAR|nr:UDP-N-acetylglucosamine transferase subunit ALG14 homolog [Mya arenaria]WAR23499.1 ALG14-like protein [Mya arenaria]
MEPVIVIVGVVAASFIAIAGIVAICLLVLFDKSEDALNMKRRKEHDKVSLLAVLGSGGHTTELLRLVDRLGDHYQPRFYVLANTDAMSRAKVEQTERDTGHEYAVHEIPRSREVDQSWFTTVLSTLYASLYAFPLVVKLRPEIILCNGPGTCIPICVAGILMKIFYSTKVIYVESICRVETLSLSGKILYRLADSVIVQWPQLQKKYPKTVYMGRIG